MILMQSRAGLERKILFSLPERKKHRFQRKKMAKSLVFWENCDKIVHGTPAARFYLTIVLPWGQHPYTRDNTVRTSSKLMV